MHSGPRAGNGGASASAILRLVGCRGVQGICLDRQGRARVLRRDTVAVVAGWNAVGRHRHRRMDQSFLRRSICRIAPLSSDLIARLRAASGAGRRPRAGMQERRSRARPARAPGSRGSPRTARPARYRLPQSCPPTRRLAVLRHFFFGRYAAMISHHGGRRNDWRGRVPVRRFRCARLPGCSEPGRSERGGGALICRRTIEAAQWRQGDLKWH